VAHCATIRMVMVSKVLFTLFMKQISMTKLFLCSTILVTWYPIPINLLCSDLFGKRYLPLFG
jgi:hypothetical protein